MLVAFDTETYRIGPGAVAPKIICASWYSKAFENQLLGNDDLEELENRIRTMLIKHEIVGHNIAYDLGVVTENFPKLLPLIFTALDENRIHDTRIREKLILLGTTGKMDMKELPDGSQQKISLTLSALEMKYLAIDRSDQKVGDDIWRLNYASLDGLSAEQYPIAARTYALEDAEYTYKIYNHQEGRPNLNTETFHVAVDFALFLMTIGGWRVNEEEVKKVEEFLASELTPDRLNLLVETGILRAPEPPRPHKRGNGMTKGKAASINKKVLAELVASHQEFPVETAGGGISCAAGVIADLALIDPVLEQYEHRQKLQKLVTTYIPAFYYEDKIVERIHPCFDVLKETGRTSSYKNKLYPSCNIQQVDPRVRQCFIPDEGYILLGRDYNSLELCTLGWQIEKLFGHSSLCTMLRNDGDPHAYLGSIMAREFDSDFRESAKGLDTQECYFLFLRLKEGGKDAREFYEHYRTFAKPTGLGYPGGLGAKTFITYAKDSFEINLHQIAKDLNVESAIVLAETLKELWFTAFPEMHDYFDWINTQIDRSSDAVDTTYEYISPLGMLRRHATFCAAANGFGLQTPSAEPAKLATYEAVKACYTSRDALGKCIPLAFIHDEIIIETPIEIASEASAELDKIMCEAMELVLPGVPCATKETLYKKWRK